jgi:hypothetical protein
MDKHIFERWTRTLLGEHAVSFRNNGEMAKLEEMAREQKQRVCHRASVRNYSVADEYLTIATNTQGYACMCHYNDCGLHEA